MPVSYPKRAYQSNRIRHDFQIFFQPPVVTSAAGGASASASASAELFPPRKPPVQPPQVRLLCSPHGLQGVQVHPRLNGLSQPLPKYRRRRMRR
jgi:hypothetical protein